MKILNQMINCQQFEELSTKYNVGRSTIREALKVLATQNIITIRQGSGTFISGTTRYE